VHELGAVVLADVEGVDPDGFGEDSFLDRVPDRLGAVDRGPGFVDRHWHERVEAEFECPLQFCSSEQLLDCSNVWVLGAIPRCPAPSSVILTPNERSIATSSGTKSVAWAGARA